MSKLRSYLGWLRRRPKQIYYDYNRVRAIKERNSSKKKIYYFGIPEHSNLGDLAQCYCIRRYLSGFFSDYEVVEVFTRNYMDNSFELRNYLKSAINDEDLIFFQSGYCTQDIGGREDFMHQMVIQDYPNNNLIMLPQTVYFRNVERKELAARVYNQHRHLLFLARDHVSYETALQMFPNVNVKCYPDIVTTLIGSYDFNFNRSGVLFCIRNDTEKFYTTDEIQGLKDSLTRDGLSVDQLDTTIHAEYYEILNNLQSYIEGYFSKFAKYKVVITDRYHGTIFSLIANTPVIVIQTKDHKVKSGVNWFKGIYDGQVMFAESLAMAEKMAIEIVERQGNGNNKPYFMEHYYSKLRGLINI